MKRRKLFVGALYCAWVITVSVWLVEAAPQGNPEKSQSALSILMEGWGPFTSEEEIRIAGYLKREAEAYLKLLEPLSEPECADESSTAEETDDTLQLIASDLGISLKEIITTLGLMERFFRQRRSLSLGSLNGNSSEYALAPWDIPPL
jgi:hypothetical protein